MYEKYKSVFDSTRNRYILIGSIVFLFCLCIGYIFYQPSGTDYQRARESVERIEKQQRESLELNRGVQRSIERGTDLTRETGERIDRSQEYNQQIGERIEQSQGRLSEARDYLIRNAILFRRIEEQSRERQENNQTPKDATQPITDIRSGCDNRSSNSLMNER